MSFLLGENLKKLIDGIFKRAEKFEEFELSYEAHPNHTSEDQLQTLYDLGSRRNSFGIPEDFLFF